MPHSEPSFDDLRTRSNRRLEKAGHLQANGEAAADISQTTGTGSPRIQGEYAKRALIESLATGQPQREYYTQAVENLIRSGRIDPPDLFPDFNIRNWRDRFIAIREMELPWGQEKRDATLRATWLQLGNSVARRFQELFSRPEQMMVPKRALEEMESPRTDFGLARPSTIRSLELYSVLPCIVSADLLPTKLAVSLKLMTVEEGDKPLDRIAKKADLAVVNGLKVIFDSARPINHRDQWPPNNRVLVISEPSDVVRHRYPGVSVPDSSILGGIIYTREINREKDSIFTGKFQPRRLSAQHFSSAYAARRKTRHEYQEYATEIEEISRLGARLKTMNGTLQSEWKPGVSPQAKENLVAQGRELIAECIEKLRFCENRFKLHALKLMDGITTGEDKRGEAAFLDSLGRPNVAPIMAKTGAAERALRRRYAEMTKKGGYNEQDHMMIRHKLAEHEEAIESITCKVAAEAERLKHSLQLFSDAPLSERQIANNVQGLMIALGVSVTPLNNVTLRPFKAVAEKLRGTAEELKVALTARDREKAMDACIKIHVIGKLYSLNKTVEEMKDQVVTPHHVNLKEMSAFVGRFHALFSERQLFPERVVPEVENVFEKLEKDLAGLKRALDHYAGKDLTLEDRRAMFKRMKEFMKVFDLEAAFSRID
ncbi:MAG: hypothetical protein J5J00_17575 [Deltaproteobacteria bacterium]|nr:hypothetical protein [Deltaproteobacteria bacterium]